MDVCYGMPDQDSEVDVAFFRQLEESSHLRVLVLMGIFNHPGICWRDSTAGNKQSRRFLESFDSNFLIQVIKGLMWRGAS